MYKSGEVSVRPCGADGDVARDSAETNGSSGGCEANSRREDAAIERGYFTRFRRASRLLYCQHHVKRAFCVGGSIGLAADLEVLLEHVFP